MSTSELDRERLKLIELSQFVLNRKTEDIRSELYEHIICGSIYHVKQETGVTEKEIQTFIQQFYGLDVSLKLIDTYVQKLVIKKDLIITKKGKNPAFILSEQKLTEITEYNRKYELLKKKVEDNFIKKVKERFSDLSEPESEQVIKIFYHAISSIFEAYGSICSEIIAGKKKQIESISSLPDFQKILLESVKEINNTVLRKVVKDEFTNLFFQPSRDFTYFLYSMAESYTIAQILNLDPELQVLEKENFSRKKLLLDTNLVVSLMCVAQAHKSVVNIISITRDLGIKMVYTQETKREFLDLLKYSKELYARVPKVKKSIIKKVEPLMENPFIKSYWVESEKKRLTWEAFTARMETFDEILKEKFSITMDTSIGNKEIWTDSEYKELEHAVSVADINKPQSAVAHDAYHILLVKKMREKEDLDELGMKTYFLTRDYTLGLAERIVYKGARIPSHIPIDVWFQMIMPFISPKIITEEVSNAYLKVMSSKFPSLTKSINPKDLIDIMGVWMDDPEVSTDLLRKIIGSEYVRQHLRKIREEPEKKISNIGKIVSPILKEALSNTRKKHETEISNLRKKYDQDISELRKQIDSLKTYYKKGIHKPLFATGVILFLALIICTFIACSLSYSLPGEFYISLTTAGILLVASSVFGPIVFEKFKK